MNYFVKQRESFFREFHGIPYSEYNRRAKKDYSKRLNKKFRSFNKAIRYDKAIRHVSRVGYFRESYPSL